MAMKSSSGHQPLKLTQANLPSEAIKSTTRSKYWTIPCLV